MDTTAYIVSGVLELYCLGLATETERAEVEQYAKQYPEIMEELVKINDSLEAYALKKGMVPKASVRTRLLMAVYDINCGAGKKYPPLMRENSNVHDIINWLEENEPGGHWLDEPEIDYDNLLTSELPSTEVVTNFMVRAKKGHEEEVHATYKEFVAILKGHCDMYFRNEKRHYNTGDIIVIPPGIPHHAIITSEEPMIALVQRQVVAA